MPIKVLWVDDEQDLAKAQARLLTATDPADIGDACTGMPVFSAEEALATLELHPDIGIVITDLAMPGVGGIELLEKIKERDPMLPVILVTGAGTIDHAVDALKKGAEEFLQKPVDRRLLLASLRRIVRAIRQRHEIERLQAELDALPSADIVVAESQPMKAILVAVRRVAKYPDTVLITGESGVGKEVIARLLHRASGRADAPFLAVNCGAFAENLLESELFGYVKGAFTGADRDHKGIFREANGGTVFLDEVGDAPMSVQIKLLRVLQERAVRPVGGTKEIPVSVRVIAATNRNLQQAIAEEKFREDLYYRLNVIPLDIPPLRQRREDIPALVRSILRQMSAENMGTPGDVTPEAMRALMAYGWPGNIRQLQSVLRRSALYAEFESLRVEDIRFEDFLPESPSETSGPLNTGEEMDYDKSFRDAKADFERRYLLHFLRKHAGNVAGAAREMDRDRKDVYASLTKYGIDPESFRT